jgi:putative transposase
MTNKRHSPDEIAAKLRQADAWIAQGKLHGDIAKALGVSLMTYHRWRKGRPDPDEVAAPPARTAPAPQAQPAGRTAPPARVSEATQQPRGDEADYIAELQLENSRLRRLVTDLLLEKVQIEEALEAGAHRRRS